MAELLYIVVNLLLPSPRGTVRLEERTPADRVPTRIRLRIRHATNRLRLLLHVLVELAQLRLCLLVVWALADATRAVDLLLQESRLFDSLKSRFRISSDLVRL